MAEEFRSMSRTGKRIAKSVIRGLSRVDFRNPSSLNVVLVIKAIFSIFDPQNRAETNTYFVYAPA